MGNKRFLVTGGCGTIGTALTKALLNSGNQVCSLDISEDGLFRQNQYLSPLYGTNYKPFLGDIRDQGRLSQALRGVDSVYHCAALKHVALCEYNPFEALKTNVLGTNNLLQACLESDVERLVFASSDKAVNPTSTMGTSKLLAEKLVLSSNNYVGSSSFKACSVRFGNVWASNGSVGLIFKEQCKTGIPITVTSPEMTRFFITEDKAVELCQFAMNAMHGGEIFIRDMGALNVMNLAYSFADYFGNSAGVEIVGLKPGEKLYEELCTPTEAANAGTYKDYIIILPAALEGGHQPQEKWLKTPGFRSLSGNVVISSASSNRPIDPYELCTLIDNT